MTDTAPILLRPRPALAAAMTAAAEGRGISRQAWMLATLEAACAEYVTAVTPDDVPLFDEKGAMLDQLSNSGAPLLAKHLRESDR